MNMLARAVIFVFGMLLPMGALAQTISADPSATQACVPTSEVAIDIGTCLTSWVAACEKGRNRSEAQLCWWSLLTYWEAEALRAGDELRQAAENWDNRLSVQTGWGQPLLDHVLDMDQAWRDYQIRRCRFAQAIAPVVERDDAYLLCSAERAFEQTIFYRGQLALLRQKTEEP